jgi:3-oxoacyl-[acyl-carrier-protein] synthase II
MLCGGCESSVNPVGLSGFVAIKALSERNDAPHAASRPWDKNRDGFVMGEGAGVLVLESLDHALARGAPILAEYLGGAISCDAYHMTSPREDGLGVALCIEQAMKDAAISKEEVNYVNAHATSTLAGDKCEIQALKEVFKEHVGKIKINATKSMIGHCLGAAGGIEAIVSIKTILTGMVHPTINLEQREEFLEGLDVPTQATPHRVTAAMSNSFGFGGHNASIIFGPYYGS